MKTKKLKQLQLDKNVIAKLHNNRIQGGRVSGRCNVVTLALACAPNTQYCYSVFMC